MLGCPVPDSEPDDKPLRRKRVSGLLGFVTGQSAEPANGRAAASPHTAGAGRSAPPRGRSGPDPDRPWRVRAPVGASRGTQPPADSGYMVVVDEQVADHDPLVDPAYDADDRNWVRYRPAWGGTFRLLLFAVIAVLAVMWLRGRIYGWVDDQIAPDVPPGLQVELSIEPGSSLNDIAGDLYAAGVISNATVFRYWLRCEGELTIIGFLGCDNVTAVEAGDYLLRENMSFESVLEVLSEGPESVEVVAFERITIPEGLRWTEMADLLVRENPAFVRAELESAFASLVEEADYLPPEAQVRTLEGMLFPATYQITPGGLTDEHGFLRRLSDEFDQRFANLLAEFDLPPGMELPPELAELGLRPYDVVVTASLIEEEALVPEDRSKIARVIYNRLANNEPLHIESTICYAAGKPCAELTGADFDLQSPWNTRLVRGLPPTPISAPGEASLQAALRPAEGDWLFYVLTDAGGVAGAHHFSVTLEEHNAAVQVCREIGYCE